MQTRDVSHFDRGHQQPTISKLLRRDIDEFVAEVRKTNRLFLQVRAGRLSPQAFGRYLRSIHYLFQHTTIHLSLAEERARRLGLPELAAYYAQKRLEEEGHDRWAEADIERLRAKFGVEVPDEPTSKMKVLVEANANGIKTDPFFYLAYTLFAEYFVVVLGPDWIRATAENCGVPESLQSAIGNHVELDRDHVEQGCAEIDALVSVDRTMSLRQALVGMMQRLSDFSDELCDLPRC